jgi:hypothetical protein
MTLDQDQNATTKKPIDPSTNSCHVMKQILKRFPQLKGAKRATAVMEEMQWEEDESEGSGVDEKEVVLQTVTNNQGPRRKPVKDWNQARLGRFPRPGQPPEIPPLISLLGLWPKFNRYYDDYEGGPTLETFDPHTNFLADYPLVYFANKIVQDPWDSFKDYGWRILPSFGHMFYLRDPIKSCEHILAIGLLGDPPGPETQDHIPSKVTGNYSLSRGEGESVQVQVDDIQVLGAAEMLSMAGLPGSPESHSIFVRGKTPDGKHIHVDLERDAVAPSMIHVGLDVDSLIWVGHTLKTRLAVKIFATPQMGKRPPIYKHNHAYVDILVPPSEEDRDAGGGRDEWWTKSFPLSNIPHVHFGSVGDGSGTMNIYLALPRIAHKHPHRRRWSTLIPYSVQTQLWERVIIPAMVQTTNHLNRPYIDHTLDEHMFKGGRRPKKKGSQFKAQTYPFQPKELMALQEAMRELVSIFSLQQVPE